MDLEFVQAFIREQLTQRLLEKTERDNVELGAGDKEIFFGMYQDACEEFEFLLGEEVLIMEIVKFLRNLHTQLGFNKYTEYFEIPRGYKISKNDTDLFPVGLFFGKKKKCKTQYTQRSPDAMTALLFSKLKPFFEKFLNKLTLIRPISDDIIKIVDLQSSVRADVICIFCVANDTNEESLLKRVSVQYYNSTWNLSNFKKHIMKHIERGEKPVKPIENTNNGASNKITEQETDSKSETNDETQCEFLQRNVFNHTNSSSRTIELSIELLDVFDDSSEHAECSIANPYRLAYEQFSNQSLLLEEAVMINSETKSRMVIRIDGKDTNVNICEIAKDGSCLFSALAFQISPVKINSNEHASMTSLLRKSVVEHIRNNYDEYEHVLRGRVFDELDKKTKKGMKREMDQRALNHASKYFVEKELTEPRCWGGAETIKAVTEIHKVNVLVMSEGDTPYFPFGFRSENSRTVFIAYRLSKFQKATSKIYDHYDAISDISQEIMYKIAAQSC